MREESAEISVIIPTRNRALALGRCLESLEEQTLEKDRFEVIVVFDGLGGAGSDIEHRYNGGVRVRFLHQPHSGPASARNRGVADSRADLLAFTDDDCIPEPRWLELALRYLNENPTLVALEGAIEPVMLAGSHAELGERVTNLGGGNFATANMIYRKRVFQSAGGFNPRFRYPRLEDTELALRVRHYGPIEFRRDVIVRHPVSPFVPWGRALRTRYLACDIELHRMDPSFFAPRGIRRERDILLRAFATIFRTERERDAIRYHPWLLPQFLVGVGLEKVAIAGLILSLAVHPGAVHYAQ